MLTKNAETLLKCTMYYAKQIPGTYTQSAFNIYNVEGAKENLFVWRGGNSGNRTSVVVTDNLLNYTADLKGVQSFYATCALGSGDSTPTKDDYGLESLITDIHILSIVEYINSDNALLYVVTCENQQDYDITISEIGLFYKAVSYNASQTKFFMAARDTFPPITLQPRDKASFTITID